MPRTKKQTGNEPANKQKGKKTCSCCHIEKNLTEYYLSYSPLYSLDQRVPVCKDCCKTSVLNNDGTINSKTFQNTIAQNNLIIGNAKNQSVTWEGDSGIIVRNFLDARELVRIVSGGIFISNDAGQNWSAAVTGSGINANYLTTGAIDTSRIYIGSGKFPTFK